VITAEIILVVVIGLIVVSVLVALRARHQPLTSKDQFTYGPRLFVGVGASVVLLSLIVYSPYLDLLYIFLIAPIICLICLVLLVVSAVRKRPRQCLSTLLTLIVFLAVSAAILKNEDTIRASFRWLAWSRQFKAKLLGEPAPGNGELRHMEWEATGFAGVANVNIYLVFDPTDSLAVAAKSHSPGKFSGIPCEVPRVSRLESRWYAVLFYTDERWGKPKSDCGIYD